MERPHGAPVRKMDRRFWVKLELVSARFLHFFDLAGRPAFLPFRGELLFFLLRRGERTRFSSSPLRGEDRGEGDTLAGICIGATLRSTLGASLAPHPNPLPGGERELGRRKRPPRRKIQAFEQFQRGHHGDNLSAMNSGRSRPRTAPPGTTAIEDGTGSALPGAAPQAALRRPCNRIKPATSTISATEPSARIVAPEIPSTRR